jgi:hypothetical protein
MCTFLFCAWSVHALIMDTLDTELTKLVTTWSSMWVTVMRFGSHCFLMDLFWFHWSWHNVYLAFKVLMWIFLCNCIDRFSCKAKNLCSFGHLEQSRVACEHEHKTIISEHQKLFDYILHIKQDKSMHVSLFDLNSLSEYGWCLGNIE